MKLPSLDIYLEIDNGDEIENYTWNKTRGIAFFYRMRVAKWNISNRGKKQPWCNGQRLPSPRSSRRNLDFIPFSLSRMCTFYCREVCDAFQRKGTKSIKAQSRTGLGMRFCRRVNDTAYLSRAKSTFRVDLTFNPDIRATFQILLFRVGMCAISYIWWLAGPWTFTYRYNGAIAARIDR